MDNQSFDQMTRRFARGGSRRIFLTGVAGIIGGAVIGARSALAVTTTTCKGLGYVFPGRSGGNSGQTTCYSPKVCYFSDGKLLNCSFFGFPYQTGQGGKSGCCLPGDAACINAIVNRPPPNNCTYAP